MFVKLAGLGNHLVALLHSSRWATRYLEPLQSFVVAVVATAVIVAVAIYC